MGRVELALRQEGTFQRLCAIKRMHPALLTDSSLCAMFVEEARVAGLIRHPNVVGVVDVGTDIDGPFLAMDFVDGISLRDVIRHAETSGLVVPVQVCCRIAAEVARGLDAAHTLVGLDGPPMTVVHRDVSPQNVLLGADGVVRVVDFGIAKVLGAGDQTRTGILKGKLGYMAPEVLKLQRPTPATDMFSVGVVLFEILAACRLYTGEDDVERAQRILNDPPPDVAEHRDDVPVPLQALLLRLLAKEPSSRPSASDCAEQLLEIADALAKDEGRVDIRSYLDEAFTIELDRRRAEIEQAVRALHTEQTPTRSAKVAKVRRDDPLEEGRSFPRRWRVAAITVMIVGTLSVAIWRAWESRPEPTPSIAGVQHVTLSLQTSPPGARVVLAGTDRGLTPLRLEMPRSDQPVEARFELEGHEPLTRSFELSSDLRAEIPLLREADAGPPESSAQSQPTRTEGEGRMRSRMRRVPMMEAQRPPLWDD